MGSVAKQLMQSNYEKSFSRNIGVLTAEEQEVLRNSRVAVAGLGGIGGATFLSLVRMGIGHFHISDIDEFGIENLNRQVGSNHRAFGKKKIEVMAEEARLINPDVQLTLFPQGVSEENMQDFLEGVDAVADCIDYFCLTPRLALLEGAHQKGTPLCFVAPLAFSAAMLAFTKEGMSYKEYFDIDDSMDRFEKLLRFSIGLMPKGLHQSYMDFKKEQLIAMQTGPSIASSVFLGGGFLSAELLFTLIGRRRIFAAPYFTQLDLLRGVYVRKILRWGNRGWLQKIKIAMARREYEPDKEAFLEFIK